MSTRNPVSSSLLPQLSVRQAGNCTNSQWRPWSAFLVGIVASGFFVCAKKDKFGCESRPSRNRSATFKNGQNTLIFISPLRNAPCAQSTTHRASSYLRGATYRPMDPEQWDACSRRTHLWFFGGSQNLCQKLKEAIMAMKISRFKALIRRLRDGGRKTLVQPEMRSAKMASCS